MEVFSLETEYQLTIGKALLLFLLLLAFILGANMMGYFLWGMAIGLTGVDNQSNSMPLLLMTITNIVAYTSMIHYVFRKYNISWKYLKGKVIKSLGFYLILIMICIVYLIFASGISGFINELFPIDEFANYFEEEIFSKNIIAVFITICVVAPIFEEILLRGIFLKGFVNRFGKWKSILLSSFLFAIFHMNIWQGVNAFFLGIILGWIYIQFNSLPAAIFVHFFNNLISYILHNVLSTTTETTLEQTTSYYHYYAVYIIIGAALVIGLMFVLNNCYGPNDDNNSKVYPTI